MRRALLLRSLREAVVTMLAASAALLSALGVDPEPGPAILAVVLCLSLSRSHLDRDLRGRLEAVVVLPVVSFAALGVAVLLHELPAVGAATFVAAVSLSIWLRRFGAAGRKAGSLIALPFVVILVTPYVPPTRVSHAMSLLLPVIVALLALFWVGVSHALARRLRLLAPAESDVDAPPTRPAKTAAPASAGGLRPIASTRMALQMGVALGVAFVVGGLVFPERRAWIVLTAFIVGSGNHGRLDVVYKSLLRVLGAGAGTAIALAASARIGAHDTATVALILLAVFVGTWLRPVGYAWWALSVTLALALLQGYTGTASPGLLGLRLEEIAIGALVGVAAAWFVLPVRSTDVLRKRVADTLAALADALDPSAPARTPGPFLAALARLDKIAPPFRAVRWASRLTSRLRAPRPTHRHVADWIDTLAACRAPAVALIEGGHTPGGVRKAVGAARKALRQPQALGAALQDLRQALADRAT